MLKRLFLNFIENSAIKTLTLKQHIDPIEQELLNISESIKMLADAASTEELERVIIAISVFDLKSTLSEFMIFIYCTYHLILFGL